MAPETDFDALDKLPEGEEKEATLTREQDIRDLLNTLMYEIEALERPLEGQVTTK